MPRTTLDLDAAVLADLRRRSTHEHKSMGQVASELLARSLAGPAAKPTAALEWLARDLGTPRVDLDDREALQSVLDAEA